MMNYQEEQKLKGGQTKNINFATVTQILDTGLKLRFDGATKASQKVYKCNREVLFYVGDRVKVFKDGGTYIVEYPVGAPKKEEEV